MMIDLTTSKILQDLVSAVQVFIVYILSMHQGLLDRQQNKPFKTYFHSLLQLLNSYQKENILLEKKLVGFCQ